MSHAHAQTPDSPYSRENYFHELSPADDPDPTPEDRDWGIHHHFKPDDKNEQIAHSLLRESATMLCYRTLFLPAWNGGRLAELCAWLFEGRCIDGRGEAMHKEKREVELTDPELHIPKNASDEFGTHEYGQYRHRRRVNPETGYISAGESTSVHIQDRPEEQFLTLVREWLHARDGELWDWQREQTIQYARRLKRGGDEGDVDVLTKVVKKVREKDFQRD